MTQRPVHHLHELLESWEDFCLLQQVACEDHLARGLKTPGPYIGGIKHWQELRQDILQRKLFDEARYGLPAGLAKTVQLYATIPYMVWAWSYWSRRAFRLCGDLQTVLLATSTKGVTYNDLSFPFEAFLLELDVPIRGEEGREYDAIFVSTAAPKAPLKTGGLLSMIPLLKQPGPRSRHDKVSRAKLRQLLANRRWNEVRKLHGKMRENFQPVTMPGLGIDPKVQGHLSVMTPVTKMFADCQCGKTHERSDALAGQMVRLVAGFCLYLKTLPSGQSTGSDWTPLAKSARLDGSAITNQALICEVGSEIVLDPEERNAFKGNFTDDDHADDQDRPQVELRVHFRMGHWRRPPGSGNDPSAPKIVHVRPTLVRRDRLAQGGVPAAARTTIS